jgi:hypothetical protein
LVTYCQARQRALWLRAALTGLPSAA